MAHTLELTPVLNLRLNDGGHASYVPKYITPTILRSVHACNPTASTTARLPGESFLVDARLTVGPLMRPCATAIGRCRLKDVRAVTLVLKRGINGNQLRIMAPVCVSRSRLELAEPEAVAAERKIRAQAQDEGPSVSAPALPSRLPPDTARVHAQVVPELASLLDHMERKSSMLVISTTDASMDSVLPFQLPSEYGCVVLGFFDVESVEVGGVFPSILRAISRL